MFQKGSSPPKNNSYIFLSSQIISFLIIFIALFPSLKSKSIIINRASYNENLTNVREAIKELGKYELRKYELNRQKQILATKKDEQSKKD